MYTDNIMKMSCSCGGVMSLHMHSLFYSTKVKITHVPVYTCKECSGYKPLPYVKQDLGELVVKLNESASRSNVSFADRNELANVLKETISGVIEGGLPELEHRIRTAIQIRIDLLLDIYQLAKGAGDPMWMAQTGRRLSQLTIKSTENDQCKKFLQKQ